MNEVTIIPLGTVSPYPKDNKNCPGFLIKYGNRKILLDCGHGASSLMKFPEDLNNLSIIISHLHVDHYADLPALIQASLVYKRLGYLNKNLNVYISGKELIYEDNKWGNAHQEKKHSIDYQYLHNFKNNYPVSIYDLDGSSIKIDTINIDLLKVPHPIETYAFRINTPVGDIVYSADTGTDNKLREFAKECDLFICESTFLRGQCRNENNHLFAYEAALIAKEANVKKLLLTHFWPEIDKELYVKEAKEIFSNTEAAEEGKKLILRR